MNKISARELFEKNNRFDLIYKILFLENLNENEGKRNYYKKLYLESIKVFNGFLEDDKKSASDFEKTFIENYASILEKGFNANYPIPINNNYQLFDGAHRLAIAYVMGIDVIYEVLEHNDRFDYTFFKKKGINHYLADIGAREYVAHNKHAHIAQVFPIVSRYYDSRIEAVLNRYGFIYYKKKIKLNLNGLIRIKQINYGSEYWAGNIHDDYAGLKKHAKNCLDYGKLRIYIFVCQNEKDAVDAKREIREMIKYGNYPIHINDNHHEAVKLANIFFNENSIDWVNSAPYNLSTNHEKNVSEFINYCKKYSINKSEVCISGSSVLSMYGLRDSDDIDCISTDRVVLPEDGNVSSHESERRFYPDSFENLVYMHKNTFVINDIKYLSLNNLAKFKFIRHEFFKDIIDIYLVCIKKRIRKILWDLKTLLLYIPKEKIKRILIKWKKNCT